MQHGTCFKLTILIALLSAGWTVSMHGQNPEKLSSMGPHFSVQPTESEIFNARVFDEPLLPLAGQPKAAENQALAAALVSYADRPNLDDFSSLTDFLARFPESTWRDSLLLHLGIEYYNYGYYSKALGAWERGWEGCKNISDSNGKAQRDRMLAELARMYSKLGRMGELSSLLESAKDRSLDGPATQLLAASKDALWLMQNQPEVCFRCGPLALDRILSHRDPAKAANPLILNSKSTTNGFSLPQVAELSSRLGMNYQMAFRSPGAVFIVPAVIHWKVGHYAALTQREGDRFLVQDHTFHDSVWMTEAALDGESSGYFLVPAGRLPKGWRAVPEREGQTVWGKGVVNGIDPNGPSSGDPGSGGSGGCGGGGPSGMPVYDMTLLYVSLKLQDAPVGYSPPVGPAVRFKATYNQAESHQPATF